MQTECTDGADHLKRIIRNHEKMEENQVQDLWANMKNYLENSGLETKSPDQHYFVALDKKINLGIFSKESGGFASLAAVCQYVIMLTDSSQVVEF